jgi:hypothetical protein
MYPVPDTAVFSNLGAVIDDSGWVNAGAHQILTSVIHGSVFERQGDPLAVSRRKIHGDQ